MPVKAQLAPDVLFGDARPPMGPQCLACTCEVMREQIDNCLLGMLGEGPYAGRVPIYLSITELWRRLSDPERAQRAGTAPYPRKESALRSHIVTHRADLWKRVKAAKTAAGY